MQLGLSERSSVVRMAQYESGIRTPKKQMTEDLAGILEVDPAALTVPDIDSYNGLMHTLFVLEERYGKLIARVTTVWINNSDDNHATIQRDRCVTTFVRAN